ncbi:MAG: tetratricopeptide repeat protein [Actinomycetota bacterium]|nr:tetratricopeptide repeat protein [Actinomycetota bacterium]
MPSIDIHAEFVDYPKVAYVLNNLAGALGESGELDTARTLYERARRVRDFVYGPDYPYVAATLNNLTLVLRDLN